MLDYLFDHTDVLTSTCRRVHGKHTQRTNVTRGDDGATCVEDWGQAVSCRRFAEGLGCACVGRRKKERERGGCLGQFTSATHRGEAHPSAARGTGPARVHRAPEAPQARAPPPAQPIQRHVVPVRLTRRRRRRRRQAVCQGRPDERKHQQSVFKKKKKKRKNNREKESVGGVGRPRSQARRAHRARG